MSAAAHHPYHHSMEGVAYMTALMITVGVIYLIAEMVGITRYLDLSRLLQD